jgi:hypothetical protein
MLTEVTTMRPPLIAHRQPRLDGQLLASMEACVLDELADLAVRIEASAR